MVMRVISASQISTMPWVRASTSEMEPTRRSLLVAVVKKSRESKVMRHPGAKVLPPMKANHQIIRVEISLGTLMVPLPGVPTFVVSGTRDMSAPVKGK